MKEDNIPWTFLFFASLIVLEILNFVSREVLSGYLKFIADFFLNINVWALVFIYILLNHKFDELEERYK